MRLHNYMEDVVINVIDNILKKKANVCSCERCKLDIAAIVLNNLQPKYVVTEKGELYTRIKEMEIQFEVDVVREVTKAIEIVNNNPHHKI